MSGLHPKREAEQETPNLRNPRPRTPNPNPQAPKPYTLNTQTFDPEPQAEELGPWEPLPETQGQTPEAQSFKATFTSTPQPQSPKPFQHISGHR